MVELIQRRIFRYILYLFKLFIFEDMTEDDKFDKFG